MILKDARLYFVTAESRTKKMDNVYLAFMTVATALVIWMWNTLFK